MTRGLRIPLSVAECRRGRRRWTRDRASVRARLRVDDVDAAILSVAWETSGDWAGRSGGRAGHQLVRRLRASACGAAVIRRLAAIRLQVAAAKIDRGSAARLRIRARIGSAWYAAWLPDRWAAWIDDHGAPPPRGRERVKFERVK